MGTVNNSQLILDKQLIANLGITIPFGQQFINNSDTTLNGNLYVNSLGKSIILGDLSINGILSVGDLSNYYNKRYIDASFNSVSIGNYYSKEAIDSSLNAGFYNKTHFDTSFNSISVGNFYTKAQIDSSINTNFYNKTQSDNIYATLVSPTLTGTPIAPTATSGTNTTQIATTAFVRTEVSNLVASAPSTLDTLNELASALGNDANFSTTVTNRLSKMDNSINIVYTKTTIDSSINVGYYNKTVIDTSVNTNFFNKTQIQNTYAPLSTPSFTGKITSAGDLSLNSRLSVLNDVSMNSKLYVANVVSIATTSSIYDLNVDGTARINVANSAATNKLLVLNDGNSADAVSGATNFYGFGINTSTLRYQVSATSANHVFYAAGNELMRIDGDGNVGIATPNPTRTLEVTGKARITSDVSLDTIVQVGSVYGGSTTAPARDLSVYGLNVGNGSFISSSDCSMNGNISLSTIKGIYGGSTTAGPNKSLSIYGLNVGAGDMYITGSIGIGIAPTYPLEITPQVATGVPGSGGTAPPATNYFINNVGGAANTTTSKNVSIKCQGIWSVGGILITSDIRIKKDVNDINGNNALDKFRQLKPVEYYHIDKISKESSKNYGFIAQEVKEIIPESISLHKDYIPNVYELATVIDNSLIVLDTKSTNEFTISGDILKIKLYDYQNQSKIVTLDKIIDSTSFTIKEPLLDSDLSDNKIFVYGQEVNDFHILSKETVFTVATAALQEVDRELEKTKIVVYDISMNMPIYKTRLEQAEQKIHEQSILILQLQEQINEINKKINP
jgi:hypothetical protein